MMRIIIQIILLTIFSSEILACADSYQYRLFPIGLEGQSVIAMETSLVRYWAPDTTGIDADTRTRWKGTISLMRLKKGNKPELIETINTIDILDRDYVKELNPYFAITVEKAKNIKDIVFAENTDLEFWDFKLDYKNVFIKKNDQSNLTINNVNGKELKIDFPHQIIEQSVKTGGIVNQDFKMISIRSIEIGDFEFQIINIASGEEHNTDFIKQKERMKKHEQLENAIIPEITIYHGLAFDSIIWN